jgi:hypothetical protein
MNLLLIQVFGKDACSDAGGGNLQEIMRFVFVIAGSSEQAFSIQNTFEARPHGLRALVNHRLLIQ